MLRGCSDGEHSHLKALGWKGEVSEEIRYGQVGRSPLNMCHFDAPSSYLWLDYSRPGKSTVLKMSENGVEGCGRWRMIAQGNTLRVHCLLSNLSA